MRRYYIAFIATTVAIISLQGLFVSNLYSSYLASESEHIEDAIQQTLDGKNFEKLFGVALNNRSDLTVDDYFEMGVMVDAGELSSIFHSTLERDYPSIIELHNSRYIMQNLKRRTGNTHYNFISEDIAIGLRGYQFIKVYAEIPLSHFIASSIWILALSVVVILLVIILLVYLIATLRAKQREFSEREKKLYGIMHDLKSPLSGVAMTLDFARQKVDNPQIETIFSLNESKISHLIAGINTMLTLGKSSAKLNREIITDTELRNIIDIIIDDLKNIYSNKPHTINVTTENIAINADKISLTNILRNLIENSVKYSDSGVEIFVDIHRNTFTVSDNGWGIPRKYHKKVFKNFYQLHATGGYGVGLSHVGQMIKEHQGTIALESIENQGTKITFTLPQ